MAQFLKAKFLSEALKWKANPRHASDQFFAGLRYDPYIYAQARLTFPEYNKRFPAPANKEFVENFARDLTNPTRNQALLKIISPETLTPEMEAANSQFETGAHMEQQSTAQATGQPTAQPFSLTTQPISTIPRMPVPPTIVLPGATTTIPETEKPVEAVTPAANQTAPIQTVPTQTMPAATTTPQAPVQPQIQLKQPKIGRPQIQTPRIPSQGRFNFSAFGSRVSGGIAGGIGRGLDVAQVPLGRMGNQLLGGMEKIINPRGIGGAGSRSIFGRFGRIGRGGWSGTFSRGGGKSVISSGAKKWALGFGIFFLIFGLAFFSGINGTTPIGEAAPISSSNGIYGTYGLDYTLPLKDPSIQPVDIRAQITTQFPNAQINNWQTIIDQARTRGFNPAFVLALWIEESGAQGASSYIDPLGCGVATPTTDINISLKCLFNFDSQHNFTNDQFIDFMIIYAGGTPGQSLTGNDNFPKFPNVVKSWYSKLVPTGAGAITPVSSVPPPPADGNYTGWVKTNFNIDVSALPAPYPQWAYEILSTSAKADIAPKFRGLISRSLTKVVLTPGDEGSHTSGDTVYIRPGYDVNFFKQIFIHELGHRIKGTAGTTSPTCNNQTIEQIESEGYLTYYAEHATPAQVRTPACGDNNQITRSDEDFGESVSYYINNEMGELNYGSECSTYNSVNPYTRGDRPAHKAYIQCLLGP